MIKKVFTIFILFALLLCNETSLINKSVKLESKLVSSDSIEVDLSNYQIKDDLENIKTYNCNCDTIRILNTPWLSHDNQGVYNPKLKIIPNSICEQCNKLQISSFEGELPSDIVEYFPNIKTIN